MADRPGGYGGYMGPGLSLRLPVTTRAPRQARHQVVDGLELDGSLAAGVALLVSEAVTNSVLHAGLDARDVVHVDAWWCDGCVRIEVCDEGAGLHSPSPAGPREGGRGFKLIDRLAERWGVHSDGHTSVWFELAG